MAMTHKLEVVTPKRGPGYLGFMDNVFYIIRRVDLYRNNLKNRFLAALVLPSNSHAHSYLASRQWSLAPHANLKENLLAKWRETRITAKQSFVLHFPILQVVSV